jgi:hypothetical protein
MREIEVFDYAGRTGLRYKDNHQEIESVQELEEIAEIINAKLKQS